MNWEKQKEEIKRFCDDNNISLSDFLKVFKFIMGKKEGYKLYD